MTSVKRTLTACLLVLVLCLYCSLGVAGTQTTIPVLQLMDGDFVLEPSFDQTRYLYDYEHRLSANMVLGKLETFNTLETRYIQFETNASAPPVIWLHFRVQNSTRDKNLWMVDIHRSALAFVKVYRAETNGREVELILDCTGSQCSKGSRLGSFINTLLALEAGESVDVLVSFVNPASEILPIAFATPSRFQSMIQRYALLVWTANGAWMALLLAALLMGRAAGWTLMLSFIAYAAIGFLMLLTSEGFLSGISGHTAMVNLGQVTYHLLFPSLLLFSRQFFKTKVAFPITDWITLAFITVTLFILPLKILGIAGDLTEPIGNLINPILAISIHIFTAARAWKRRISGSATVLAGAVLMLIAIVCHIFNNYLPGFIHRDSVNAITHIAFLFEAILFAAAIGLRQLEIRRERDEALRAELRSTRERLRLTEALQASTVRFEQARNQARERQLKLATLSHDLKQPLLSLRHALSDMTLSNESNERMQAAFDYLEKLAQRQLDERADSEPLPSESSIEKFPVSAVLDNVIAMFQAEAASKGLKLRYHRSTATVHADPMVVMRIMSNLVSNAIKHVDSGDILVGSRIGKDHLRLQVHDTGGGMNQHELETCMKAYGKGDSSDGNGLGLHLVASLSEEAGFELDVASTPGNGSSFSISVPREKFK